MQSRKLVGKIMISPDKIPGIRSLSLFTMVKPTYYGRFSLLKGFPNRLYLFDRVSICCGFGKCFVKSDRT